MSRKEEYKLQNEQFLEQLRTAEGIKELPCGILYRVLEEGRDGPTPRLNSVVSVHYKGTLINGREFDNSWKRNCPEAFRLNEVIEGWQIALLRMHPGSRWIVYIPYTMGYGTRTSGPIPAYSTLICPCAGAFPERCGLSAGTFRTEGILLIFNKYYRL